MRSAEGFSIYLHASLLEPILTLLRRHFLFVCHDDDIAPGLLRDAAAMFDVGLE
jgi:hypothetical protein